jgi:hypothetical protein
MILPLVVRLADGHGPLPSRARSSGMEPTNLPHAEALREVEPRSTDHDGSSAFWILLRGRPDCVGPAPQHEGGGCATTLYALAKKG